jgi:quercetin dioxygenase-like cupin family protein
MPTHLRLDQAERIPRSYGELYLWSRRELGFVSLQVLTMVLHAGEHTRKHYHPSEETFVVVSGAVTFVGIDGSFEVRPHEVVLVPPNEVHALHNHSSGPCELVLALSPPRSAARVVYCDD